MPSRDKTLARLRAEIESIQTEKNSLGPSASREKCLFQNTHSSQEESSALHFAHKLSSNADTKQAEEPTDEKELFLKIARLSCMHEQASVLLKEKFLRAGYNPHSIDAALDRALRCGLVDDLRYADSFIRTRLAAGYGRQGIISELSRLGIDFSQLESNDSLQDESDEIERALFLLTKKPPRSKNKREAAYRRLIQKGYGASISSSAARMWCEKYFEENDHD